MTFPFWTLETTYARTDMRFTSSFLTALSWGTGGVLIIAAFLKMSAAFIEFYHFNSVADGGEAGRVIAVLGIAVGEIILAFCLMEFAECRDVWIVAAVVFLGLFGVSLSEGIAGKQSCDCLDR